MLREFVREALSRIRWNIIGRNPSMVIPLLANQDLKPAYAHARSFLLLLLVPPPLSPILLAARCPIIVIFVLKTLRV